MTQIDLIDYTHSSKKIPSAVLNHAPMQIEEIKSSKIIAAYFLDFVAITTLAVLTSGFLKISLHSFMVTSSLRSHFEVIPFTSLTVNFMPLFFISYFFFSYFFNQGQTWGMSTMKNRIEMKEQSFRSSLFWAMFSSAIMMTGGASFLFTYKWVQKKGWGEFKEQDHLYSEMMQVQNLAPINVEEFSHYEDKSTTAVEEDNYLKAA